MKIAFIFPGQGAQYPGMGKEVLQAYPQIRETLQEGDDILKRNLSKIFLEGSKEELTRTLNAQPAIYLLSVAYTRLLKSLFPRLQPSFAAGLSLGEYTALATSGIFDEALGLKIVQERARLMTEACQARPGAMAAVVGLSEQEIESLVKGSGMPHDLWAANFNAPTQAVVSGTLKGVEEGTRLACARGAKVIPLSVEGAFHSGLMQRAQERLADVIQATPFHSSSVKVAMNASGGFASGVEEMKELLIRQVTQPVRWQGCMETLEKEGTELFVEIGCGKTLSGLNRKILKVPTLSFEKPQDLDLIAKEAL